MKGKRAQQTILVFALVTLFFVSSLSYLPQNEKPTIPAKVPDDWIAKPMSIVAQDSNPMNAPSGYSPSQIKAAYGLPSSGGAGATIAIIEAYKTPSLTDDLTAFSTQFNLPLPTSSNFEIHR